MKTFENPNHHKALAKNIGVAPRCREANEEEISFAKKWMELRTRAVQEDFRKKNE